jgi:Ca2+-binding EF-hand superfamily protein
MGNKSSLMLQNDEIKQISSQTGFSPQQIEKLYSRFTQLDRANCGSLSKHDLLSIPELAINPLCDRLIEMFFVDGDHEEERINFRQFMRVLAAFRSNQQQQVSNGNSVDHIAQNSAESDEAKSSSDENNDKVPAGRPRYARRAPRRQQRPPMRELTAAHDGRRASSRGASPAAGAADGSLNDRLTEKLYFVFKIYDNDNDGRISFNDLRSILKMMVGNYIEDVQLNKIATRAFVEVDQDNDGFIEFDEFCRVFAGKDMEDKLRVKFF